MTRAPAPTSPDAERRRRHLSRGARAEWQALVYMLCKGFRPLARRWLAPGGEIDLVLARGRLVVFVEVKARAALGDAADALGPTKRRRILRAVKSWRSRNAWADCGWSFRIDAVFIARGRWPVHVPDVMEIA